jgi:REP element-mobilizing transposase RayT
MLDAGRVGPVHLKRSEIASIVHESIHHCAANDYDLHEWVIVPNHVHLLITPWTDMPRFMRRLKG